MKVIINKCYGGFGISTMALKELVKRNAKCIESFTPKHYYGGDNEKFRKKAEWEKIWKEDFSDFVDIGDGFMADERRGYNIYKDGMLYQLADRGDLNVRTDKDLIEVCEKLGLEKSSSSLAKLAIVEIPDGVEIEIDDYDGMESVHEKHRVWY